MLSNLKSEDAGVYVCEISNGIGRAQQARATLVVECKYFREKKLSLATNSNFLVIAA